MLRAPFPWFGGKSRAASEVWAAIGDVPNYVEPFAGSLGVLLGRPGGPGKIETINDNDALLINVWRAIAWAPSDVAAAADWPVSEADLSARHMRLVERRDAVRERLCADPDWFDAKLAGWWVWGACSWIGSGWCSGSGPWSSNGVQLVKGNAGMGINRQLPHLGNAGMGINRQLPHLGDAGRGINRQGVAVAEWLRRLSDRLRSARITCGDWRRVATPTATFRHGMTGLVLDPPYPEGWDTESGYSGQNGSAIDIWMDVTTTAAKLGERRDMRVVVCGYEGTWEPPAGWSVRTWTPRKGYAVEHTHLRERLWCSPACIPEAGRAQASLF